MPLTATCLPIVQCFEIFSNEYSLEQEPKLNNQKQMPSGAWQGGVRFVAGKQKIESVLLVSPPGTAGYINTEPKLFSLEL